jgi:hypothetical protein
MTNKSPNNASHWSNVAYIKGVGHPKEKSQTAKQAFVRRLARMLGYKRLRHIQKKKKVACQALSLKGNLLPVYSGLVIDEHIVPTFHDFLAVVELYHDLCAIVTDNNSVIPTFVRHQQGATATDNFGQFLVTEHTFLRL